MAVIDDLVVNIRAETAGFSKSIADVTKKLAVFGAASIAAAGTAVALLVTHSMEAIDALAKMSDKLGISTEALIGLQHGAELSGVSIEGLNQALKKMTLNRPGQSIEEVADAIMKLDGASARARMAVDVFGRAGIEMLPMLQGGAAGIAAFRQEADELGLSLSRVDAAKVEEANDEWTRTKALVVGIGRQLAIDVSPVISGILHDIIAWGKETHGFKDAIAVVEHVMIVMAQGVINIVNAITRSGQSLGAEWSLVAATFGKDWAVAIDKVKGAYAILLKAFAIGADLAGNGLGAQAMRDMAEELIHSSNIATAAQIKDYKDLQTAAVLSARYAKDAWEDVKTGGTTSSDIDVAQMVKDWQELARVRAEARAKELADGQLTGDALKEARKAEHDALVSDLNKAQVAEQESFNARLEQIKAFEDDKIISHAEATALTEAAQGTHEKRMGDIQLTGAQQKANWDKLSAQDKRDMWASTFANLMTVAQGHNKKMFEIMKKAALAEAIVSTAAGVAKTFRDFGWYALLGPAEAVAAAGLAQITQIKAQSFDGGGSGGGAVGSAGSAPDTSGGGASASGSESASRGANVTINLGDDGFISKGAVRKLIEHINEAVADGSTISGIRVA